MPRLPWIVMTVLASSWLAASVGADTLKEQAHKAVIAGLEAQNAGRYDEAIAHYRKAYDAVPHHEILFNLAQAHRLKGDTETALGFYQRYLAVEPRGRVAADARKWVSVLETLVTQQTSDARKAEEARKAEDAHKAEEARKAEDARKADLAKSQPARPEAPAATGVRAAIAGPAGTPASASPVRAVQSTPPRDDGFDPAQRRRYVIIAGAAGGAAVVAGTLFGALARNKRDDAVAICGDDGVCDTIEDAMRANSRLSASRTRGNLSTAMFTLGGLGLATSAILWFTGRDQAMRSAVAPVIAPSIVGVTWEGGF
jgi:hypothetical protein